ncbi:MAG: NAD(P)-dependent alcohol dehydrogenase [Anaerolineae bacterium]|nr:NAD(P)-dependent alcohol dehydrogenase [Anaerolineae bacterium]
MKAIVWTKYGSADGLQLREVAKPSPKDNEVLIKVYATTVTTADCELRSFKGSSVFWLPMRLYIGFLKPTRMTILGQELAGDIEATGKDVTHYKKGDAVFAWTGLRLGGNAEYACLSETATMAIKPANMTYAEAAAIPLGGLEAWQYLNGTVQAGQQVLIIGAGGSIGTFAVQLAKHFGAEVTAVDHTEKLDMLRSIGADQVIDYTKEDFTKNGQTYDVIFDAPGKSSLSRCERSLKPNGQYLSANPGTSQQLRTIWNVITRRRKATTQYTNRRTENLAALKQLIEAGKVKSVIDRQYPLEQTAEAHRYVETGMKRGNVVITIVHESHT